MKKLYIVFILLLLNVLSHANSKDLYLKECNEGNSISCTNLGLMYEAEDFTKVGQAVKFYKKACDMQNARACNKVGVFYTKVPNYFDARGFFQISCDSGYTMACINLGVLYEKGQGGRQSYIKAEELYGKACDNRSQLACEKYAHLHGQ